MRALLARTRIKEAKQIGGVVWWGGVGRGGGSISSSTLPQAGAELLETSVKTGSFKEGENSLDAERFRIE